MSVAPSAADTGAEKAWLEFNDGQRWPLRGNCHLGRAPENDIVIDDPKASRQHAAIHAQDETEFWLLDLGSRNGTYLNENRLIHPSRLRHSDRLNIGGHAFAFHQPAGARTRAGEAMTERDHSSTTGGNATVVDLRPENAWLLIADIERFTQLTREWEAGKLAMGVGRWLRDSRRLVARHHGRILKYLGDGFLACWIDHADAAKDLVATLDEFRLLRASSPVKFRVALHCGLVTFGGQSELGEESMLGPEVNFVFRLEDLASNLGVAFCLSSAAQASLAGLISTTHVPGEHKLKGFPDTHHCFCLTPDASLP